MVAHLKWLGGILMRLIQSPGREKTMDIARTYQRIEYPNESLGYIHYKFFSNS
jgi:hypothetical protein